MSSFKHTTIEKTEKVSYVEEINTPTIETYEAQHPMLAAMHTHINTPTELQDHLLRYSEVTPYQ
tara:strand:+ start:227 stop:418 length:192 start_codon:yes stop_codon:yes gene_type:complete